MGLSSPWRRMAETLEARERSDEYKGASPCRTVLEVRQCHVTTRGDQRAVWRFSRSTSLQGRIPQRCWINGLE